MRIFALVIIAVSFASAAWACPEINGTFFSPQDSDGSYFVIQLETKKSTEGYQYSLDGTGKVFHLADGVERPYSYLNYRGTIAVNCAANWMTSHVRLVDGSEEKVVFTKIDEHRIRVISTGNVEFDYVFIRAQNQL